MVDVIGSDKVHHISEEVRPGAGSAVHHARNHEQSVEILRLAETSDLLYYVVVVVDGVMRRRGPVVPAVILEQFPAVRSEGGEIGIPGIEQGSDLLFRRSDILIEVEVAEFPVRIVEDKTSEECAGKNGVETGSGCWPEYVARERYAGYSRGVLCPRFIAG